MRRYTSIFLAGIICATLAGCSADTSESATYSEAVSTTTAASTTAATVQTTTTIQTTTVTETTLDTTKPIEEEKLYVPKESQEATAPTETKESSDLAATNEAETPTTQKPSKPSGTYTLADTDIQNPDGTYSAKWELGDTIPGVNEPLDETALDAYKYSDRGCPNPSKIPYSQITVDNAHKAFPYLGEWLGYVPEYYEITPGMTKSEIELAIALNFGGFAQKPVLQPLGNAYKNEDTARFFFKSNAEYTAWADAQIADHEQRVAAAKERGDRADAFGEAVIRGEASIGGNGSDDFYNSLLNSR